MRIPHTRAALFPELRPGRFAELVRADPSAGAPIALLGLPDDTGVRLNGGRPGAAEGPQAFRAALAAFGTPWDARRGRRIRSGVFDAGDVVPAPGADADALFATHARVREAVGAIHEAGLVPVCIGGGHDLSAASIGALFDRARRPLGGVNLDAHLDVRERIGSGMPFRRLIEAGELDPARFVELGVGRFVNDEGDLAWLGARGARIVLADDLAASDLSPAAELEFALGERGAGFVSLDLDALDMSVAPGVSALNPLGVGVRTAAALAEAAGRDARVRHFDLMELCPAHDLGGRTARIAAFLFLSFVAGFEDRT